MKTDSAALLVVKLDAQQWNTVLAALSELKLKDVLPLWQVIMAQLQDNRHMVNGAAPPADEHVAQAQ